MTIIRTLATLDHSAFAQVADKISSKSDTALLAAFEKVSPVVAQLIAQSLPDLSADQLRKPDDKLAARIFIVCAEANVFRSFKEFPLATLSEVIAARDAKPSKIRSYLALPNRLALALRPDHKEYRANDTTPTHCAKFDGDALSLCLKNTRAVRSALALLLDRADIEARKVERSTKTADEATKDAPKRKKTEAPKAKVVKAPRVAPKRVKSPTPAEVTPAPSEPVSAPASAV